MQSKLLFFLVLIPSLCCAAAAQGPSPLSNSPELLAANMLTPSLKSRNRKETIPGPVTKQYSQEPKLNSITEEEQTEQENQPTQ